MNKLILCEGKTDAILLSYYLRDVQGWMPCRKAKQQFIISVEEKHGESAYWYKQNDDYLLICGVGGKDNFKSFFVSKIKNAIIDSNVFAKIAIVTDRDDREETEIINEMLQAFRPVVTNIEHNIWQDNEYQDSFGIKQKLSFLLLVIPMDKEGALETLLLDAISENEYDRKIVERSTKFVEDIEPDAKKYIGRARLKLKARLGVTWAIQSPGKEFNFIDEQIRSVSWGDSKVLAECFCQLVNI